MSIHSAWNAFAFSGSNQTGTVQTFAVGEEDRFHAIDEFDLYDVGLLENVGSVELMNNPMPTSLIVFDGGSFSGDFRRYTNTSSSSLLTANQPSTWKSKTRSMAMIRHEENEYRVGLSTLVSLGSKVGLIDIGSAIDSAVEEAEKNSMVKWVRKVGSWEMSLKMFPEGIAHLSKSSTYLNIRQRLEVQAATIFFGKYSVDFSIFVRFYIQHDKLEARVESWSSYVSPGTVQGVVDLAVQAGLGEAAIEINKDLGQLSYNKLFSDDYVEVYLLPGETNCWVPGVSIGEGDVWDDVTMVLVR